MNAKKDLTNEIRTLKGSINSDLDVKIVELAIKREEKKTSVFQNPLIISIFSALVGLTGLILGKIEDSRIQANQQKVKFESDLILQTVNVQEPKTKLQNLEFIMRLGLLRNGQLRDSVSRLIAYASKDTLARDSLFKYTISNTSVNLQGAEKWDSAGFDALFNRDVIGAIEAFNKAEQSFSGYHMAYDIWFYLRKHKDELLKGSDADWKNTYEVILKQYSWRMDDAVKQKLRESIR
jgi:hypothetical protein